MLTNYQLIFGNNFGVADSGYGFAPLGHVFKVFRKI
ncbi:hypothetical protein LYNGBM3L_59190 [Moorena producens 3L]|uniref:Uncharacterized protein n=1 Tax=Moorena producens 3L TaxID=489825 RepID=F4XZX4_9CYAN|nr:hypothetical protein LYNGBM3L_59190 [Moorena producens 3L]